MGNINRMKRKPKKWKKIAANYISDKWLVFKFYKGRIQLNRKKPK